MFRVQSASCEMHPMHHTGISLKPVTWLTLPIVHAYLRTSKNFHYVFIQFLTPYKCEGWDEEEEEGEEAENV